MNHEPLIGLQNSPQKQPATDLPKLKEIDSLKKLQDLTFELQILDLQLKNRQDEEVENKIKNSMDWIQSRSQEIVKQFAVFRSYQNTLIREFTQFAKKSGSSLNIQSSEYDHIDTLLESGAIDAGMLTLKSNWLNPDTGNLIPIEYEFARLSSIRMGHTVVLNIKLPEAIHKNFWHKIRQTTEASKRIEEINYAFLKAKELAIAFYKESHLKLYHTFEDKRFDLLSKLNQAHRLLIEINKSNNVAKLPHQYAQLYNHILDQILSFGVNVSYSGKERDFNIQGFLLAETPEEALNIVENLKFKITPEQIQANSLNGS